MLRAVKYAATAAILMVLAAWLWIGYQFSANALRIPEAYRRPVPVEALHSLTQATGATAEEVSIRSFDGLTLRGSLLVPKQQPRALMMLLHGHADHRGGVLGQAQLFLEHGYAVLAPDHRGHGVSDGEVITFGALETQDVEQWLRWAQRRFPALPQAALGESMGAGILLQALPEIPWLRAAIAENPFATIEAIGEERITQAKAVAPPWDRWVAPAVILSAKLAVRAKHGVDLGAASPQSGLRQSKTPVLLIHGTADDNISVEQSRLLSKVRAPGIEYWEIPGGHHCAASMEHPGEFRRRVLEFLARQGMPE